MNWKLNWKLYLLVGFLVLSFAGYVAHSIRENGALGAKLERAEADSKALETRNKKVTKDLEQSNRELKDIKEARNATVDRINNVADPTGCLDVVLDGTDFARELRDAWGNDSAP